VDIIWPNTLGVNLRPERPNGVFLFSGPTGVGKTELARALTEFLFGSPDKMIRIDMSEYSEAHTVSRLLGAPFGYQGFDEGSPFLNEIAENPFSVLLLDEIEKAHPSVHRLFLQVFDSGVLTDMQRQHIYFSDVIIIMTSNILVKKKKSIGYGNLAETETDVRQQLTGHFAPEFLNRIDFIGAFNHLSSEVAQQIVESKIIPLLKKRWKKKQILLEFTPEAVSLIAEKGCTEKWGARNLERTVNETINSPLAKFISGKSNTTIRILVTEKKNGFEFKRIIN
jgi:ATP-dependent Clp protease ATP-binding subunit ClpA